MSILRDLFTGIDGVSHDIGRYLAAGTSLVGLGLQVYVVVWKSQPFDMLAFGAGASALAIGIGGMLKLKAETEPKA